MTRTCLLVLGLFVAAVVLAENKDDQEKKPTPKVTIGKETTYVTGPLDKDGYIDYAAALNERLGKGVTPQNNANVLLWKALGPRPEGGNPMPPEYFKWLGIESPPEDGEYFLDLFKYMKEHLKVDPLDQQDELNDQQNRTSQRPWTAKDYPHIAGWLKANEKPLALVVEASKRTDYFNPLVAGKTDKGPGGLMAALLPSVQKCRALANALTARAMLHVAEGRPDEAWQDLLACHRLGRLLARGGTLIEALVGIAIDQVASNADLAFLAHAKLTAKQLQACLNDLQGLPAMPVVADKVNLSERFMFLDCVQLVRRYGLQQLEVIGGLRGTPPKDADPKMKQALDAIDWDSILRNGNRWYDRMVAAMRLKDRAAREKEFEQIDKDLRKLKRDTTSISVRELGLGAFGLGAKVVSEKIGNILITLLLPAISKVQHAADRTEQVHRNLHLAFALAAYHRDQGRYPAKLAALAPKYVAQVPDDLFSGKAIIYRPAENGYLLYSVGVNGQDDGGRWHDDDLPGDDPRVRMPLPELRRK